jgi:hypothetical protein
MSWNQKNGNDGVCPHCGIKSGVTIVETNTRVCRVVRPPWWKFWEPDTLEWLDEQDDQKPD